MFFRPFLDDELKMSGKLWFKGLLYLIYPKSKVSEMKLNIRFLLTLNIEGIRHKKSPHLTSIF